MRTRRGARLAIVALAGATGLLAALDLHLLQSEVDISPIAPPGGRNKLEPLQSQAPATALDKKTAAQLSETVGRPLFHPSRRPVQREEAVASAGQKAEPPTKLRLIGIVRPTDQPPRALIRFAGEPMGTWLVEGAEHKGWRLSKVNARSVLIESGRRAHELTLPSQRSDPVPPVSDAAPSGGETEPK
jgi:hypothetical protein